MSAASKIPPLRFNGFDGEWVDTSLEGLGGSWFKGQPFSKNDLSDEGLNKCIHYGELFTIYGAVIENVSSTTNALRRIGSIEGDLLFPASDVTPDGLGRCSALFVDGVLLGGDLIGFRQDEVDSKFLSYAINNCRDQIIRVVTGTTVRHSSAEKLKSVVASIPVNKDEQQKIGATFRSLDALIADRELAVEKLQTLKKAMLEKMFPRAGAKVPEVRFKGFEGVWRKVRLDNVCTMFSGGTPTSTNHTFYGGDVNWVSISDMTKSGKYITETEKQLTQEGFENCSAKMFPPSTLLFAMYASIGKCCIAPESVCSSQAILGLYNLDGVDVEFLYYDLSRREKAFAKMGQTGSQANLSKAIVSEIKVNMPPTFAEQLKIGAYFRSLDALISARQEEVGKLKDLKKALLDRMFV